jgi:hypothetical protein
MQKAVGRVNALVVAVSILVIAFRAGTQTSPYSSAGPEAGSSQGQSSPKPIPGNSLTNPDRRVRILAVTPAPVWERRTLPRQLPGDGGSADKPVVSARDVGPRIPVKPALRTFLFRANKPTTKQVIAPSDAPIPIAKPNPAPTTTPAPAEAEGSSRAIKIVSLRSSPSATRVVAPSPVRATQWQAQETPLQQGTAHHPSSFVLHLSKAADTKPGFLFPDAVSPYHPVPMTSAKPSATPKPLGDEVVKRATENPPDKEQASPLSEHFRHGPAKSAVDLPPQPVPVKPEEMAPKPALKPDSPQKTSPPLDDTKPESGGSASDLPEVLLDSPSPSLVQASYQSKHPKATGVPSNLPAVEPKLPAPSPEAKPPDNGQNSAESSSQEPVVKVINHEPEDEFSPSPPRVITPDAQYPPPTVLPGQPSETTVPAKQRSPVRRFILMPQAIDDLPPDPEPPKEAPVLPEKSSALEQDRPAGSSVETLEPPLLQALPVSKQGILAGSGPSANSLGKLPSFPDPTLVLGPATELLESKRAGVNPDRPATPERPTKATSVPIGDTEKPLPPEVPSDIDTLKNYIQAACGEAATSLAVELDSGNQLHVRMKVKNDADGERIGRKILDLPHLAPYQVSLDIEVVP